VIGPGDVVFKDHQCRVRVNYCNANALLKSFVKVSTWGILGQCACVLEKNIMFENIQINLL
jgi:hypothetical protein